MKEVAESSDKGYSQAVEKAISKLIEEGYKIHFFQLMENRGAVKGNKIEYQIILKVSLESEK
ncbi:MAG: dodecin domain-containing protein [Endomicrobiales bacterium]|nr:dodecin domain-containing protein [Endomicrobiales bacterium]